MPEMETDLQVSDNSSNNDTAAVEAVESPHTHDGDSDVSEQSADGASASGADADGDATPAAPVDGVDAYQPNTKYKVDGKEIEFDEKVKKLLSRDSEPVLRELVEKAHGIEAIKARHTEVKQERDQYKEQLHSTVSTVREILQFRDEGDLDSVFDAMKIPFDKVAQHVYKKLKAQEELPEAYRGVYDENRQYRQRMRQADQQVAQATEQANTALLQARSIELDTVLSSPDIKAVAAEVETRLGEMGSTFRQAVIEYAASREYATQTPVSAKDAVEGYLKLLGRAPGSATPAATNTNQPKVIAAHKPQTLPNVGATALAPTARKPKSLKELRDMSRGL